MKHNPITRRHAEIAREHYQVAQNYARLAGDSPVGAPIWVLAHCEACKATEHAALAGDDRFRVRAAELSTDVARHLKRTRNPYEQKGKANFVAQGTPWPQEWEYRGWRLVVRPGQGRWYHITVLKPGDPSSDTYYGAASPETALERGRLYVDLIEYALQLSPERRQDFIEMDATIDSAVRNVATKQRPTRADVARLLKEWNSPSLEGRLKAAFVFFDNLPLKDRLKWLDSAIKSHRLESEKPNPYERKKKATFATQGTPWPQTWEYEGWQIRVHPSTKEQGRYIAEADGPSGIDLVAAPSAEAALERMRMRIDMRLYDAKLSASDSDAFRIMEAIVNHAGAKALNQGRLDRATVSRLVEAARTEKTAWGTPADMREAWRFFDSLPLKDRLAWIDSTVKQYELSGIRPPKRNTRNPARKKKRETRRSRRSILRKLLRP